MEGSVGQEGESHLGEGQVSRNSSPILYCSASGHVILIDLPASIARGQAFDSKHNELQLRSCDPVEQPYLSTEPKSSAALARLQKQSSALIQGAVYENLIRNGLAQIHAECAGPWCLPRQTGRRIDTDVEDIFDHTVEGIGEDLLATREPRIAAQSASGAPVSIEIPCPPHHLILPEPSSLRDRAFYNPSSSTACLQIESPSSAYLIPPRSAFIHTSFSASTINLTSLGLLSASSSSGHSTASGHFDLILFDPPWANRSARRSAGYRQASSRTDDPFCGLREILPYHLAPGGFLACWITHAAATRRVVEDVFAECDVDLVEEWVWAKVTPAGDMSVKLGSKWRRGWEVLLIGKKREDGSPDRKPVVRRLIASVPDLHSRKPCVKELFNTFLLHRRDARVLEFFARHLTAGWCALGDEVLRFNWEGHWRQSE